MIDPTPHVRKLAEAELYRAELELRRLTHRVQLLAAAYFIAFFALAMFGLAGFFALSELYGYPIGALITGAVLGALAILAFIFAAKPRGRANRLELELATRNVEQARAEVKRDFDKAERMLNDLTLGALGIVKGSAGSLPMISIVIGAIAALSPALRRFLMPFLRKD